MDKLAELDLWKRELQGEAHTLIDFFCEDKETMKLDECFQIFRDFCTRFNKAVKVRLAALFPGSLQFSFFGLMTQPVGPLPMAERWSSVLRFQDHLARWHARLLWEVTLL